MRFFAILGEVFYKMKLIYLILSISIVIEYHHVHGLGKSVANSKQAKERSLRHNSRTSSRIVQEDEVVNDGQCLLTEHQLKTIREIGYKRVGYGMTADQLTNYVPYHVQKLAMAVETGTNVPSKPFERLPADIVPLHYWLTIDTDLEQLTFCGSLVVSIGVRKETSIIVLNSKDLKVSNVVLIPENSGPLEPTYVQISKEDETMTIKFAQLLAIGYAELELSFDGILSEKMHGYYRTKYTLEGEDRWAAATQFESTFARYAFPCWVII